MSDYSVAQTLHTAMTADSLSYIPMPKDELRDQLEIGRIENPRAARIVEEFEKAGLLVHPAPTKNQTFTRVFRLDTELGTFVHELLGAQGEADDEQAFARAARRLEAASPAEVFKRMREVFEEEGWVRFRQATE
ncbi:MAG TPA: hypothetical protein VF225_02685 [Gaiellaceae bacterium]